MPRTPPKKRVRRDAEQLVADLQARIEAIKARAARKRAKSNPAVRHTIAAIRSMDKAIAAAEDTVLKKTLDEARSGLTAYLSLQGIAPAGGTGGAVRGRRSAEDVEQMAESTLAYVKANPGQRGEQIAEGMKTDSKTIRLPMKRLIAAGEIKTRGERRATRYYPV